MIASPARTHHVPSLPTRAQHNYAVRAVTGGVINTVAGQGSAGALSDGGPATEAYLNYPFGVAVDGGGNLLISDSVRGTWARWGRAVTNHRGSRARHDVAPHSHHAQCLLPRALM